MKTSFNQKAISVFCKGSLGWVIIFFLVAFFASCTKMDYTYRKFLNGGDIIYPGRADSVSIFPGHNRIKLTWMLTSDPGIVSCRIFWNNKGDSIQIPVNRGHGIDTVSVIIDSLEEGYYNFEIYTYDKDGHRSIAVDTLGQVFGQNYVSSLHNRVIKNSYWDENTGVIFWYKPNEGAVISQLTYTDLNGITHTVDVLPGDTVTQLPDFKLHDGLHYRTGFLPDSLAIDTFFTAYDQAAIDDTLTIALPPYPFPGGNYVIMNKLSGMAVTVEGAGKSNNANIIQSAFTYAANQLWNFAAAPTSNYYEIDNVNSGHPNAIAVNKASTSDGEKLVQYKFGTSKNDQWNLEKVDGNYYKLTNLKSQKVMEVSGSSTADGATIQQNSWNGSDNQLFEIAWNMAEGQSIKDVSSGGSHPGANVIDGDNTTYWQPASSDRTDDKMVWITIDLGGSRVFDELRQYWTLGNSHIDSYKVLYSDDNSLWKTAYQSASGLNAGQNTASFPPVEGRYVKLQLHFGNDGNVNIAEVGVYYFPK